MHYVSKFITKLIIICMLSYCNSNISNSMTIINDNEFTKYCELSIGNQEEYDRISENIINTINRTDKKSFCSDLIFDTNNIFSMTNNLIEQYIYIYNMQTKNTQTKNVQTVPIRMLEEIVKLFNSFDCLKDVNDSDSEILNTKIGLQLDDKIKTKEIDTLIIHTPTFISLNKFLSILQELTNKLKAQSLKALYITSQQIDVIGGKINANIKNSEILRKTCTILEQVFVQYLDKLSYCLKKDGKNSHVEQFESEINKHLKNITGLDMTYYHGSKFQERLDKLHNLIIRTIDNFNKKKVTNLYLPRRSIILYKKFLNSDLCYDCETNTYYMLEIKKNDIIYNNKRMCLLQNYLIQAKDKIEEQKKLCDKNLEIKLPRTQFTTFSNIGDCKIFVRNYIKTTYDLIRSTYDKYNDNNNTREKPIFVQLAEIIWVFYSYYIGEIPRTPTEKYNNKHINYNAETKYIRLIESKLDTEKANEVKLCEEENKLSSNYI